MEALNKKAEESKGSGVKKTLGALFMLGIGSYLCGKAVSKGVEAGVDIGRAEAYDDFAEMYDEAEIRGMFSKKYA